MLKEIFVLELSGENPFCVFLVRPVRIRPLRRDHHPSVHRSLKLGAAEKSNLKRKRKSITFKNIDPKLDCSFTVKNYA